VHFSLWLFACLLLWGCSSDLDEKRTQEPDPWAIHPEFRADGGSAEGGIQGAPALEHPPREEAEFPDLGLVDPQCELNWLDQVEGRLLDEAGEGLEGKAQLCIRGLQGLSCLRPATANTDGYFFIQLPQDKRCLSEATLRALLPQSGRLTAYCPLELGPTRLHLEPLILYQTQAARPIEGAEPHWFQFPGGLRLQLPPEELQLLGGDYEELAAVVLSGESPGLCRAEGATQLYAFSPEANIQGDAALVLTELQGFSPGQRLELAALGGLECRSNTEELIHEGRWSIFGEGRVSSDGHHLETQARIPCLNWLRLRTLNP